MVVQIGYKTKFRGFSGRSDDRGVTHLVLLLGDYSLEDLVQVGGATVYQCITYDIVVSYSREARPLFPMPDPRLWVVALATCARCC